MMFNRLISLGVVAFVAILFVGVHLALRNERAAGYKEGFSAARLECVEAANAAAAAHEQQRKKDELAIAEIEKKYLEEQGKVDYIKTLAEVTSAYERDKHDDTAASDSHACNPAISRRMRDVINAAGRQNGK